eukprot:15034745-Alexandrium_andersonii.AAC.1
MNSFIPQPNICRRRRGLRRTQQPPAQGLHGLQDKRQQVELRGQMLADIFSLSKTMRRAATMPQQSRAGDS